MTIVIKMFDCVSVDTVLHILFCLTFKAPTKARFADTKISALLSYKLLAGGYGVN